MVQAFSWFVFAASISINYYLSDCYHMKNTINLHNSLMKMRGNILFFFSLPFGKSCIYFSSFVHFNILPVVGFSSFFLYLIAFRLFSLSILVCIQWLLVYRQKFIFNQKRGTFLILM
jgi:hypothetical protein